MQEPDEPADMLLVDRRARGVQRDGRTVAERDVGAVELREQIVAGSAAIRSITFCSSASSAVMLVAVVTKVSATSALRP